MKKIVCSVLVIIMIFLLCACGKTNDAPTGNNGTAQSDGAGTDAADTAGAGKSDAADNVNVVADAAAQITFEDLDTEAFTMQIPAGWKIRYAWDGETTLMIRVYDPATPVNQIFYVTSLFPFMKNEASAEMYKSTGDALFGASPVLDPATNETLFKQIPNLRDYFLNVKKQQVGFELIPEIYDFELLETLPASSGFGDTSLDDSVIHGYFTTADGSAAGECIGFASIEDLFGVMTSPLYGVDMAYYTVYAFTVVTSVKDELVNYMEPLCRSLGSLDLKEDFMAKSQQNSASSFDKFQQANASVSAAYDSYNAAWLARSQADDIARQKRSDATLGYERVYDTETGDIYKAYNGFTDDYAGQRYQPVTDDMYTRGWNGFIEK